MNDIRKALAEQLRAACGSVRTKSFPLRDLIPLMQQAADALSQPQAAQDEEDELERATIMGLMEKPQAAQTEAVAQISVTERSVDLHRIAAIGDVELRRRLGQGVHNLYATPPTEPQATQPAPHWWLAVLDHAQRPHQLQTSLHEVACKDRSVAEQFIAEKLDFEGWRYTLQPLYTTPPTEPAPCIGKDTACPCQDGDACHYRDAADGTKGWPAPQSEPAAVGEIPPIDRDEDMDRTYIPMPGGWEVQTKGKGSTFRLCDTKSGDRWPILDSHLHEALERMAREVRSALASAPHAREPLTEAVAAERERCAMVVWMTLQEATADDADDKGLDGWLREAEQRIRTASARA